MMPSNGGTLIHRPSASLRDRTLGSSIFRRWELRLRFRAPSWLLKFKSGGHWYKTFLPHGSDTP